MKRYRVLLLVPKVVEVLAPDAPKPGRLAIENCDQFMPDANILTQVLGHGTAPVRVLATKSID